MKKSQIGFGFITQKGLETQYTKKIKTPVYEPHNKKPLLSELTDDRKYRELVKKIKQSDIPEKEKSFLIKAAARHRVFDYSKIADYYAHSPKEVQELMEDSALVIIDFDKAIEQGYVVLSEQVANQYKTDYSNEESES